MQNFKIIILLFLSTLIKIILESTIKIGTNSSLCFVTFEDILFTLKIKQMEKEVKQTGSASKNSPKIVNLFEDGNVHTHNNGSYEKMMEHQKKQEQQKPKK